jgi:hypothetical protein
MNLAPVDWQRAADNCGRDDIEDLVRSFEGIALRAAELARYFDGRIRQGHNDHSAGMKAANKAGRAVWCGAFGYNEFPDLTC